MRKELLEKKNTIETILKLIAVTKTEGMQQMSLFILNQLAASNYQGALPFVCEQIDRNYGDDYYHNRVIDEEDALKSYYLSDEELTKNVKKISKSIHSDKEKRKLEKKYSPSFQETYEKLLNKMGYTDDYVKRESMLRSEDWTRLRKEDYYSMDKVFRIIYAMKLSPEDAYTLAASTRHPVRFKEKRGTALFLCVVLNIYDIDDVNKILKGLGEKELSGTVIK